MNPNEWRLLIETVVVTATMSMIGALALYSFTQGRRRTPDALKRMGTTVDYLSGRVDVLERARQRDHGEMTRLQVRVAELELGVRVLVAQVIRLGGTPEWTPPPSSVEQQSAQGDGQPAYVVLSALFNNEELDDLAARCDIDPESLEGRTRTRRAQSLVDLATRRGMLSELITTARELRPDGGI